MKDNTEQNLEQLAQKVFKESMLDSPSVDFTANILGEIRRQEAKATTYKPLISKKAWWLIVIGVVTLFTILLLNNAGGDLGWFSSVNFDVVFDNRLTQIFSGMPFSSVTTFSVILLAVMIMIQVKMLKGYFNNRLHSL